MGERGEFPIGAPLEEPKNPLERVKRAKFEGMRENLSEVVGVAARAELATRIAEEVVKRHPNSAFGEKLMRMISNATAMAEDLEKKRAMIEGTAPVTTSESSRVARMARDSESAGQEEMNKTVESYWEQLFAELGNIYAWLDARKPVVKGEERLYDTAEIVKQLPETFREELNAIPSFKEAYDSAYRTGFGLH